LPLYQLPSAEKGLLNSIFIAILFLTIKYNLNSGNCQFTFLFNSFKKRKFVV